MLSRVADAIYWASRYVERAENVARFINVNLDLMLDSASLERHSWAPLVATTGDKEWYDARYEDSSPQNVAHFLSFDRSYPNSIISSVRAARENARTVRDVISREMWEQVNALYLMVMEASQRKSEPDELASFYDQVKLAGTNYAGATDATLTHGEAWHFSRLGRMLERADKTSRILDVKYFALKPKARDKNVVLDDLQWSSVLRSVSALEMYRKEHKRIAPAKVVEFLLLDAAFPRAIRYCIDQASDALDSIVALAPELSDCSAKQAMALLRSDIETVQVDAILNDGLHKFIDQLQVKMNNVGSAIHETFFAIRPTHPTTA